MHAVSNALHGSREAELVASFSFLAAVSESVLLFGIVHVNDLRFLTSFFIILFFFSFLLPPHSCVAPHSKNGSRVPFFSCIY